MKRAACLLLASLVALSPVTSAFAQQFMFRKPSVMAEKGKSQDEKQRECLAKIPHMEDGKVVPGAKPTIQDVVDVVKSGKLHEICPAFAGKPTSGTENGAPKLQALNWRTTAKVGDRLGAALLMQPATYPVTNELVSGSLPPGIILEPIGNLRGEFKAAGNYSAIVKATDADGRSASVTLQTKVSPAEQETGGNDLEEVDDGTINTHAFQTDLELGEWYDQNLHLHDLTAHPATFEVESGALPPGMTFSRWGRLTGTPTKVGQFYVVFASRIASGAAGRRSVLFKVKERSSFLKFNVTYPSHKAYIGSDVRINPIINGADGPVSYRLDNGFPLPKGIVVDPVTGVVSGKAQGASVDLYEFPDKSPKVIATDASGASVVAHVPLGVFSKPILGTTDAIMDLDTGSGVRLLPGESVMLAFSHPEEVDSLRIYTYVPSRELQFVTETSKDGIVWENPQESATYGGGIVGGGARFFEDRTFPDHWGVTMFRITNTGSSPMAVGEIEVWPRKQPTFP